VGKTGAGLVDLFSSLSSTQASVIFATDRCKHQRPVAWIT